MSERTIPQHVTRAIGLRGVNFYSEARRMVKHWLPTWRKGTHGHVLTMAILSYEDGAKNLPSERMRHEAALGLEYMRRFTASVETWRQDKIRAKVQERKGKVTR